MGENECLGWFPRYTPSKPMCNDVGCSTQVWNGSQIPSAEDYAKVGSSDAKFLTPPIVEEMEQKLRQTAVEHLQSLARKQSNCSMRYEDGMIVVEEFTKYPIGVVAPLNDGVKPLSEATAQQINEAFEDIRKTMGKDFPMAFAKRKARKHYKPKFTL